MKKIVLVLHTTSHMKTTNKAYTLGWESIHAPAVSENFVIDFIYSGLNCPFLHIYLHTIIHNIRTKQALQSELGCILFSLVLEMSLELDWSPTVACSTDWT